jgi:hypothetical protein
MMLDWCIVKQHIETGQNRTKVDVLVALPEAVSLVRELAGALIDW